MSERDGPARSVDDAIRTRASIRAFLPRPVEEKVVRDILEVAARAPSGGNIQPWKVYVVAGEVRDRLVATVFEKAKTTPFGDGPWYDEFPKEMGEPFRARRRKVGFDLYALAGVARDDMMGRARQGMKNFEFFGAPVGMFFTVEEQFGVAQFVDLGMFLENICLLARARGLHTCPQEAWGLWHRTVSEFLGIPPKERMFCGLALGHPDWTDKVNALATERESLENFARFEGF